MTLDEARFRLAAWIDSHLLGLSIAVWFAFCVFVALLGLIVHRAG